jgi:hypothetical protein
MSKLEEVAATVEAIKEIDYCHLSERKILRVPVPQVNPSPVK